MVQPNHITDLVAGLDTRITNALKYLPGALRVVAVDTGVQMQFVLVIYRPWFIMYVCRLYISAISIWTLDNSRGYLGTRQNLQGIQR
jgi:hypothetical protein